MFGSDSRRFITAGFALVAAAALVAVSAFGGRTAEYPVPVDATASILDEVDSSRPLEQIDLVGRAAIEDWVEHFSTRDRQTFEMYMTRLGAYEALIGDRIAIRGLPASLLYVPVIESALSATAHSSADAVGLWQLRQETATELGLRIDEWVDERRDPVRATEAALDYLEQLRSRFGSWELALAAYNAGPSRVASRIRWYADADEGPDAHYTAIVGRLPRETREYIPKLIATRILSQSSTNRFAYDRVEVYAYDEVVVPPRTSLWRVAEAHGSTLVELRALNPHLLRYSTPPGVAYPVRVPLGTAADVVAVLRGEAPPMADPTA